MDTEKIHDIDTLGCGICLRKFPGRKYWQQSKMKMEVFGSSIEIQICPECQKKINPVTFCAAYPLIQLHFKQMRAELKKLAGVSDENI